tara:strand:+ start:275 stop:490 length:216 start_codon:yes stop_codon:yes gene_type:complete
MSINFEKGKVSLNNSETLTVNLTKSYIKPVIKLTPSEDIIVNISDITSNTFKINSSVQVSTDIYYIVIEGN